MRAARKSKRSALKPVALRKCPTGIAGLDEITYGGFPYGRTTLVCGAAGCGKTLIGMEFLLRGAMDYGEPGVCITFEETPDELTENMSSLGYDLRDLAKRKHLAFDHIDLDRRQLEEGGEYDLEGLFVRIGAAIDSVGGKRVLLDTAESLFLGLDNNAVVRSELRRLFRYLKDRGVTTVATAESAPGALTRFGLEEYVSDCVISLEHEVRESISTRRMRVVKYRGSVHGTNEYPFLIDKRGLCLIPITSAELDHPGSTERVSTGVQELNAMLGGSGVFRGSSVLISGSAGTGKSSLAAHFADATCAAGERCLYFAFEEAQAQIVRNMRSIGRDMQRWIDLGLLRYEASRPTTYGLEMHLVKMHAAIDEFEPAMVVVDPISSLTGAGARGDAAAMLLRLIDYLKRKQITAVLTALAGDEQALKDEDLSISSLVDAWIVLQNLETGGERNRGIYILKARGTAHSNQVREFKIAADGVKIRDAYIGHGGFLTGSARLAREAQERADELAYRQQIQLRQLDLKGRRKVLEAELADLGAQISAAEEQMREFGPEQARSGADEREDRPAGSASKRARSNGTAPRGTRSRK